MSVRVSAFIDLVTIVLPKRYTAPLWLIASLVTGLRLPEVYSNSFWALVTWAAVDFVTSGPDKPSTTVMVCSKSY